MQSYFFPFKPISINANNCFTKGRFYRPKAYVDFKSEVIKILQSYNPVITDCRVRVEIDIAHLPTKRKGDIDNVLKPILDAMNGIVYKDDNQVSELQITKTESEVDCFVISVIIQSKKN